MADNKKFTVYRYISPNGKSYIGQTGQDVKIRAGTNGYRYKPCKKFYRAIQKYGFNNFKLQILKEKLSISEANYWEEFYINFYNAINNGYNIKKGGSNHKHSEETKIKISRSNKGKKLSTQHKQKLSRIAKQRNKNPMLGKHHSEETKKKISEKNSKKVLCIETGIIYPSAAEACRILGIKSNHINDCINNPDRYKTSGGYHWKRI